MVEVPSTWQGTLNSAIAAARIIRLALVLEPTNDADLVALDELDAGPLRFVLDPKIGDEPPSAVEEGFGRGRTKTAAFTAVRNVTTPSVAR